LQKNVPYELKVVDLSKGAHKQPDFLAKQPFGQIPVLVDGDVEIFESRAIARWAPSGRLAILS
jgi:glutathione S-transferase